MTLTRGRFGVGGGGGGGRGEHVPLLSQYTPVAPVFDVHSLSLSLSLWTQKVVVTLLFYVHGKPLWS